LYSEEIPPETCPSKQKLAQPFTVVLLATKEPEARGHDSFCSKNAPFLLSGVETEENPQYSEYCFQGSN